MTRTDARSPVRRPFAVYALCAALAAVVATFALLWWRWWWHRRTRPASHVEKRAPPPRATRLLGHEKWAARLEGLPRRVDTYAHYFAPVRALRPPSPARARPGHIFVSIASYRDSECVQTVLNLINNARRPENVHVVVCQQNAADDGDCLAFLDAGGGDADGDDGRASGGAAAQTTIIRLSHEDARGPTWARYLIQQEWRGEEYYLQTDSHMRFMHHWDAYLLAELAACPSEKACLTQYPSGYAMSSLYAAGSRDEAAIGTHGETLRGALVVGHVDEEDGFVRPASFYVADDDEPPRTPFEATAWSASFSFSRAAAFLEDAPYDPYTQFLFFGEEMDIACRAWTHGWDFFSPRKCCVLTLFDRSYRPTFWEHPDQDAVEKLTRLRVYVRLGYLDPDAVDARLLVDLDAFSLGAARTLEDYERYAGFEVPRRASA
jgi:hypothetical protein